MAHTTALGAAPIGVYRDHITRIRVRMGLSSALLLTLVPLCVPGSPHAAPNERSASKAPTPRCLGRAASVVVRGRTGHGTSGDDVIVVTSPAGAVVSGGGGADKICGGRGKDVLAGNAGDDRILARGGDDQMRGGTGDDLLLGGGGADSLDAGQGRDRLRGEQGIDSFSFKAGRATTDADAGEIVNGRRKILATQLRSTTITPSVRDVLSLSGAAGGPQTLVLRRGARAPRPNAAIVLTASKRTPDGLLGEATKVSRRRDGATVVAVRPTGLRTAYRRYHLVLRDTTFGELAQRSRRALDGLKIDLDFSCELKKDEKPKISVDLSPLRPSLEVEIKPLYQSIYFQIEGSPKFGLLWAFKGAASCAATATGPPIPLPVPGPPLFLELGPSFKVAVDGAIAANFLWDPYVSVGFSRQTGLEGGGNDFYFFKNHSDVSFSGYAGFNVGLKLVGTVDLAGVAGLRGTFGPDITGRIAATSEQTCLTADAALRGELSVAADVWGFVDWNVVLGAFDVGNTQLFQSCRPGPPPPPPPSTGRINANVEIIDQIFHNGLLSGENKQSGMLTWETTGQPSIDRGDATWHARLSGSTALSLRDVEAEEAACPPPDVEIYMDRGASASWSKSDLATTVSLGQAPLDPPDVKHLSADIPLTTIPFAHYFKCPDRTETGDGPWAPTGPFFNGQGFNDGGHLFDVSTSQPRVIGRRDNVQCSGEMIPTDVNYAFRRLCTVTVSWDLPNPWFNAASGP